MVMLLEKMDDVFNIVGESKYGVDCSVKMVGEFKFFIEQVNECMVLVEEMVNLLVQESSCIVEIVKLIGDIVE